MTLRLDAGAGQDMVAAHFRAADAVGKIGSPPEPDAGEATGAVHRLLVAFLDRGEDFAGVNEALAVNLRQCTGNIEGTDLQIARAFAVGSRGIG